MLHDKVCCPRRETGLHVEGYGSGEVSFPLPHLPRHLLLSTLQQPLEIRGAQRLKIRVTL